MEFKFKGNNGKIDLEISLMCGFICLSKSDSDESLKLNDYFII